MNVFYQMFCLSELKNECFLLNVLLQLCENNKKYHDKTIVYEQYKDII